MMVILDLFTAALGPAGRLQQVAVGALPPRVGLGSQTHVRHVRSGVVVAMYSQVIYSYQAGQTDHD
jgi:hypothetical protein